MKNIKRITAVAMALALATCTICTPAYAAGVTSKDESVYITLNPDGSAASTTVSEWLHNDSGLNGVKDVSTLQDIKNLRSDDMPTQDGVNLMWNTDANDIYYQGSTTAQAPITASITYTLDGTQISAESAAGKSGHLKIDVVLTNNSYKTVKIGNENRNIYTPFVVAVGTNLPVDGFTNVVAEKGTVQTDSSNQIVAFACLPGMNKTFSGLLSGVFADIQNKFIDSVSIEADVTNLEIPSIMIAYATDASLLDGEVKTDKFGNAFSDIDKLTDATQQLVDGASKLADGTSQLADGTSQLASGTSQLADGSSTLSNGAGQLSSGAATLASGAAQLTDGASKLSAGASQLNTGAAALNTGLQTLSGKSAELNAGTQQIAAAILKSANTQIQTAMPGTETITLENYATVLGNILNVTDDMRVQARATVSQLSGLPDAANADGSNNLTALIYLASQQSMPESPSVDDCKTAIASAGALMSTVSTARSAGGAIYNATAALAAAGNNPLAVTEVYQVLTANVMQQLGTTDPSVVTDDMRASTYASLAANLGDISDENKALIITMSCIDAASGTDMTTAMTNASTLAQTAQTVQAALIASADGSCNATVTGFLTQLVVASNGTQFAEVQELLNSLQSLVTFISGVKQYTDGVDSAYAGSQQVSAGAKEVSNAATALADGAATVSGGAKLLSDNTVTLAGGAASLASGAASAASGAASAASGAAQLNNGAQTLSNGTKQFKSEGISQITDTVNNYDIDGIIDTVNALKDASQQYRGFSGVANDTTTTTKFVMKTNAPVSDNATSSATENAEQADTVAQTTFWQRIKNLFSFSK